MKVVDGIKNELINSQIWYAINLFKCGFSLWIAVKYEKLVRFDFFLETSINMYNLSRLYLIEGLRLYLKIENWKNIYINIENCQISRN